MHRVILEDPERKENNLALMLTYPVRQKTITDLFLHFLSTLSPLYSRCEEQFNISVNVFMFPWKVCASPPGYSMAETEGNDKVLALVVQVLVKESPPVSEPAELLSCSTTMECRTPRGKCGDQVADDRNLVIAGCKTGTL